MSTIPALTFTADDAHELATLGEAARADLAGWLEDVKTIASAGHGTQGRVLASVSRRRGLSPSAVRQRFDRWQRDGWQGLINRRSTRGGAIPQAAVQHWLTLCESQQRRRTTVKQAWRLLTAQLDAWDRDGGDAGSQYAIPGYTTSPRRLHSTGLPAGWHYATLAKLAKRQAERIARSLGGKAFSATLPSVRASREGCAVGQFLFFDDEQLDVYVNTVGNKTASRPLAFHCLDFVSGCNIARGFRPTMLRADGTKDQLKQVEFDWFMLHILTNIGWNEQSGTVLCGEMGTAALSGWMQDALPRVFGDRVHWDHSGRMGAPLRGMVYEGQSSGNFRFKAPLESWFNLERNYMAALPGATGRNRDEKPEETYGLLRNCAAYLRLLETLPLERRMLLRSPVLEWGQFSRLANALVELINRRTDHTLGQWEKCGFVRAEILDSMEPALAARLLTDPAALAAVMGAGGGTIRRMSPREVWDQHSPRLTKLKPWQVPLLMPLDAARPVKVSADRVIRLRDQEIDSEDMEFLATHCITKEGHHLSLRPGDEFLAYLNPYSPSEIQLCEVIGSRRGAWLGTCAILPRISRALTDDLMEQFGRIRGAAQPVLDDIAARSRAESRRRIEDRAVNRRVADLTKPLTPGEHERAALSRAATGAFSESDGANQSGQEDDTTAAPADHFIHAFSGDD